MFAILPAYIVPPLIVKPLFVSQVKVLGTKKAKYTAESSTGTSLGGNR
jgi:hypothetical protein